MTDQKDPPWYDYLGAAERAEVRRLVAEVERLTEEVNALRLVATAHDAEIERLQAAPLCKEVERLQDALKAIECHSIDHIDACRMAGKARRALENKP